ncbi:MAG: peptide deformylase [Candidatus Peregrinibacteria bacterium]
MKLPITSGKNNPILRKPNPPVKTVTKKILKLIRDMVETMFVEEGVGIAATQVGVKLKLALILLDGKRVVPILNPEIIAHSETTNKGEEGCLSLRGEWGAVERYDEVTIRFMTYKGEIRTLKLTGFNARVAQHEIDHLNGILFVDKCKN